MTNKQLTIIITTFKSEDKIEICLNSIDVNTKVIIVENSNNEKFKKYIEKKYQNVDCILTGQNLGYGKANNIGLKKVKTEYALILNPDTVLDKEVIKKFFIFVARNINFAILGPAQNKTQLSLKNNDMNLFETDSVKGFAVFLNMKKFLTIGFFDENFFLYLEEVDLCKRLKKINENIYLDTNIKIFHEGGKSTNKIYSNEIELTRNWHWMWSLFYYNKKHFNYFYALVLVSPRFFSALVKILFYGLFFKSRKKSIYQKRLSGLINSILGESSWYRPTLD
jgi:N-acetylglucosaminyl-diphospho-decaprenol L-rhamnosyltransferase